MKKDRNEFFHALATFGDKEGVAEYQETLRSFAIEDDIAWQETKFELAERHYNG